MRSLCVRGGAGAGGKGFRERKYVDRGRGWGGEGATAPAVCEMLERALATAADRSQGSPAPKTVGVAAVGDTAEAGPILARPRITGFARGDVSRLFPPVPYSSISSIYLSISGVLVWELMKM